MIRTHNPHFLGSDIEQFDYKQMYFTPYKIFDDGIIRYSYRPIFSYDTLVGALVIDKTNPIALNQPRYYFRTVTKYSCSTSRQLGQLKSVLNLEPIYYGLQGETIYTAITDYLHKVHNV